jgi:shikimate dehydrogenase
MISLGLTGYPLEHSLSPEIYRAALNYCDLEGSYSLFPLLPNGSQGLKILLDRVRSGEIAGLNVTIPYKQTVIPLLDELTPTAKTIGAVNTIFSQNDNLTGDNTDAHGFLVDLHKFLTMNTSGQEECKNALVLGAGGAARAVTYALINDGWKISLAARRPEQAQAFITQFQDQNSRITSIDYDANAFQSIAPAPCLVINTTPVGMSPNHEISPWPMGLPLPHRAAFYDLIYNPHVTKFIFNAREAGLRASTGLGMLVEQAALAFEIWTGYNVPREPLFAALEEK